MVGLLNNSRQTPLRYAPINKPKLLSKLLTRASQRSDYLEEQWKDQLILSPSLSAWPWHKGCTRLHLERPFHPEKADGETEAEPPILHSVKGFIAPPISASPTHTALLNRPVDVSPSCTGRFQSLGLNCSSLWTWLMHLNSCEKMSRQKKSQRSASVWICKDHEVCSNWKSDTNNKTLFIVAFCWQHKCHVKHTLLQNW